MRLRSASRWLAAVRQRTDVQKRRGYTRKQKRIDMQPQRDARQLRDAVRHRIDVLQRDDSHLDSHFGSRFDSREPRNAILSRPCRPSFGFF